VVANATFKGRGFPPGIFCKLQSTGGGVKELSVCVDESGEFGTSSEYHLVTLPFHDERIDISSNINRHVHPLSQSIQDVMQVHMAPILSSRIVETWYTVGISTATSICFGQLNWVR
jgi:hypothetical protein